MDFLLLPNPFFKLKVLLLKLVVALNSFVCVLLREFLWAFGIISFSLSD